MDLLGFKWIYMDLGGFMWIYLDLGRFMWIYLDLGRFRRSQDVCRPVAPCGVLWRAVAFCGTGVVGPKERLLQSQTAVSEAWRPVGCRLGGWD